jgi:hypothetical protein
MEEREVRISAGPVELEGNLDIPDPFAVARSI